MRTTLVVSLVIAVVMVIFALLNGRVVPVNFLFFRAEGALALVIILTFVIGVGAGVLGMLPGQIKSQQRVRDLEKQLRRIDEARADAPHAERKASRP